MVRVVLLKTMRFIATITLVKDELSIKLDVECLMFPIKRFLSRLYQHRVFMKGRACYPCGRTNDG